MTKPEDRIAFTEKDFAKARFKPHGRIAAWPEGNIVHYEVTGPFNEEFMALLAAPDGALLQLLSEAAKKGPFGAITVFKESAQATPGAFELLGEAVERMTRLGIFPVANAFVAGPDVEGRSLMMPKYARIYETNRGTPFRCFEQMDEAHAWLRSVLAGAR